MNLDYSVLWFDDKQEYFDSLDIEPLEEKIRSWGLCPKFHFVTTAEEFQRHQPFDQFDLIAIDFQLEHEGCGQDFITQVREQRIYTEVVFYSADDSEALWAALASKRLEGVFIANRRNVLAKLELVAHQTLKKVLDIYNMRGIVMAEVGDIDWILEEIIRLRLPKLSEEKMLKIFSSFYLDIAKTADSRVKEIEQFKMKPNLDVFLKLCDSSKRWENFKRIAKVDGILDDPGMGDYLTDVLGPRNFLAHGKPLSTGDGALIFEYAGRKYHFDERVGATLRTTINNYRDRFAELHAKARLRE